MSAAVCTHNLLQSNDFYCLLEFSARPIETKCVHRFRMQRVTVTWAQLVAFAFIVIIVKCYIVRGLSQIRS